MCPACIESTAVMVAGVGSAGGILAVFIGKIREVLRRGLQPHARRKRISRA